MLVLCSVRFIVNYSLAVPAAVTEIGLVSVHFVYFDRASIKQMCYKISGKFVSDAGVH